jgi:ribosomal protein L11 methyltransferase
MNNPDHPQNNRHPLQPQPYRELYIYYLEGCLDRTSSIRDKTFIGNWEEDNFSFLFFSEPADQQVAKLVADQSHIAMLDQFQMTYDEWHGGPLKAVKIAGFEILPPWEAAAESVPDRKIVLDPGVVFGTGTHPTTQDCLIALEKIYARSKVETVLDIGTGTGLLALAAARLGAKRVLAVDLNLLAVKTAWRNIRLNHLDGRVFAVQGLAENFIDFASDLVVSNIHFDVMRRLLTASAFAKTKWFILSGLLRSQAKAVTAILEQQPTEILQTWERDGVWHTFLGKVC